MNVDESLIQIRREIHSRPELSGQEYETAAYIKKQLMATEPDEIIEEVGGCGLIAIYKGIKQDEGSSVMIRAELDGLPIKEQTGLSYQSEHAGKMHACGHDGHMAILLGVAKRLHQNRSDKGNVFLLFQPAEETGRGAEQMLGDQRFKKIDADRILALHNLPGYEENTIYIRSNTIACASTGYKIELTGKSSHAAYPEEGINPAPELAAFVTAVHKLHEDYIYKDKITAATVTYLKLGEEAFGISPGKGEGGVTIRAETDELLSSMKQQLEDSLQKIESGFKGTMKVEEIEPFAAVVNDQFGVEQLKSALNKNEQFRIEELTDPFPWSEDVGEFRKKSPITFFGLGAGKSSCPLHSEKYDFNDQLLSTGKEAFWELIKHFTEIPADE